MGTGLWFVSWAIANRMRETERECLLDWQTHREHLNVKYNWKLKCFPSLDTFSCEDDDAMPIWLQRNLLAWQITGVILWKLENNMPFSLNTVTNASPQEVQRTNNTHSVLFSTLAEAGLCSVPQLCSLLCPLFLPPSPPPQNPFHSSENSQCGSS